MGSVDSIEMCEDCGGYGNYTLYYKSGEDAFLCLACGKHFGHRAKQDETATKLNGRWTPMLDKDGNVVWDDYDEHGIGVISFKPKDSKIGRIGSINPTSREQTIAELDKALAQGELETLYITTFDLETKKLDVIRNFGDNAWHTNFLPKAHPLHTDDLDDDLPDAPTVELHD